MLVQDLRGDGDAEESNKVQKRILSMIFKGLLEKETILKEEQFKWMVKRCNLHFGDCGSDLL